MDVGKFICKNGLHKGAPVIAGDRTDEVEIEQALKKA